jgi:type IX secretion system PorP/SprF family membrane protein
MRKYIPTPFKLFFIVVMLFAAINSNAQQLPQYSQYLLNDYVINPAICGSKDYAEGKSDNRYQWSGITDAPRTYILSLNGPIKKQNMGLGGYLFTDITGPTRRTGGYASYAYHIKITQKVKLSLGISAGLLQFAIDGSKIKLHDAGDNALSNTVQSVIVPDAGFGIYVYSDKFFGGISAPQLLHNKLNFFKTYNTGLSRLENHLYALGGYKIQASDKFIVEPSMLIKYVKPVKPQFDISARVIYKNMLWLGTTFRTQDAMSFLLGYTYNNLITFGYSFDYSVSNLHKYSSGTHEVMIGLRFSRKTPPRPPAKIGFEP